MGILEIMGALLKIFFLWFNTKAEKDAAAKKKKERLLQEANDALSEKDPTALTAIFDRFNRV